MSFEEIKKLNFDAGYFWVYIAQYFENSNLFQIVSF